MNTKRVRFTVYLPDGLGQRAKDAGLNLSRLLRDGVERELRGDQSPSVAIDRTDDSVDVRVRVPLDVLRDLLEQ